jgi:hypothetical protein
MNKLLCTFLFLILTFGCTQGTRIDLNTIHNDLSLGKTTKEDILRMCGEPLEKRISADQQAEVWHYAYVNKKVTGKGVLSHIVGIGIETKSNRIVFQPKFKGDILIDYDLEEGSTTHFGYQY